MSKTARREASLNRRPGRVSHEVDQTFQSAFLYVSSSHAHGQIRLYDGDCAGSRRGADDFVISACPIVGELRESFQRRWDGGRDGFLSKVLFRNLVCATLPEVETELKEPELKELRPKRNWIEFFSKHPTIALVSSITGIIGFFLGIYFYVVSIREPELSYYVHPIRTPIVQSVLTSDLAVTFKGAPLTSNLTAAQISIWNGGKSPIRFEDILSPITIKTGDGSPILETTTQKVSRDLINLQFIHPSDNKASLGEVGISWKILEQNDGAVIQVLYASSATVDLVMEGVVLGQRQPKRISFSGTLLSPEAQYANKRLSIGKQLFLLVLSCILMVGVIYLEKQDPSPTKILPAVIFIAMAFLVVNGIVQLVKAVDQSTPFGL